MKILLCPTYWEGDRAAMEDTMLLLADLLTNPSTIVSVMFVGRYDAKEISHEIIAKCQAKFAAAWCWICDRKGSGFPWGCNEIAYGILNSVSKGRGPFEGFDAIMLIESDCVVTRKDWDYEVAAEWSKAREAGQQVCGAFIPGNSDGGPFHVNAVAIYSRDIASKFHQLSGGPHDVGWDWYHGSRLAPVARDSPLFYLDYRKPTINRADLLAFRKEGLVPLVYHGVKDDSARRIIREVVLS